MMSITVNEPRASAAPTSCADCKAFAAFHFTVSGPLDPSFNVEFHFTNLVKVPAGKRAVIELVTATIEVPGNETARLRMNTSLGTAPSNLDLTLDKQSALGAAMGQWVATHSLRVYSDRDVSFFVNRDNPITAGSALICISGYIAG